MARTILRAANTAYREGRYEEAYSLYRMAAERYGEKLISANLFLCERALRASASRPGMESVSRLPVQPAVQETHGNRPTEISEPLTDLLAQQAGVRPGEAFGVRILDLTLSGKGFYTIEIDRERAAQSTPLTLSVVDPQSDELLAPVAACMAGRRSTVRFQLPWYANRIRLRLDTGVDAALAQFAEDRLEIRPNSILDRQALSKSEARVDNRPIIATVASIPEREAMLHDCVLSLLPQVDRIRVFLNGYPEIPDWLRCHAKVEWRQSQDLIDKGDAGKFFLQGLESPAYVLTCDDDIVYPWDYAQRMMEELGNWNDEAIVGVHGVVLRQPVERYYQVQGRYVLRHIRSNDCGQLVHVLGTGTTAFRNDRVGFGFDDCLYPNMADVWLAKYAAERRIPLYCVARPKGWLFQNQGASRGRTIYSASKKSRGDEMDTSAMQDSVIRSVQPFSIQPGTSERLGPKLIMAVKTYNRKDYLKQFIETFLATQSNDFSWSLIVADDGSTDGTREYLEALSLPVETHLIFNHRRYAVGQCNTIFEQARQIEFDYLFVADDDVVFKGPGWDSAYVSAIKFTGVKHLCYLNEPHYRDLRLREGVPAEEIRSIRDASGLLESFGPVSQCMGAFFTVTPDMLDAIGWADEKNFPIRGQWHVDLSLRACRAGFNHRENFFDLRGSNRWIDLQNNLTEEYRCSIPFNEEYQSTKQASELARRQRLLDDESRIHVSQEFRESPGTRSAGLGYSDVVEKSFVLNLDRRPDRFEAFSKRISRLGIEVERFSAVDGGLEPFRSQWQAYFKQPIAEVRGGQRSLSSSREYYLSYEGENQRLAYIEKKLGRKCLQSPGAWGYMASMRALIEKAIRDNYETIAVFDDDAIFHKDFHALFASSLAELGKPWKVLQLGALQYQWGEDWIDWETDHLYRTNGTSLGSHAVCLHKTTFPLLLWHCERMTMPYDEGALHYAHRQWSENCFTFFPNLVIQDVSESDINSSATQEREGSIEGNRYRWVLSDYKFV